MSLASADAQVGAHSEDRASSPDLPGADRKARSG
jgi:hypothetical protein